MSVADLRSLGVSATAEAFDVGAPTIRRWINAKKLPAFRAPSGRWRVLERDIRALATRPKAR